jgi:alpha-tubulin suppressor-like RCC1 family protein
VRSFRPLVSIPLACLALAACARGTAQREQKTLAGTYRIAVCRGPCEPGDTARALAHGVLVIGEGPLDPRSLSGSARTMLEFSLVDRGSGAPNACYALDRPERAETYAGIAPAGLTRWVRRPDGTLGMALYRSPDAGYDAVVQVQEDGLRGRGKSWGFGADSIPEDSIAGRRTGPPDPSLCVPSRAALDRIEAAIARADSALGITAEADPHPETTDAPPFASVTAGGNHACALTRDGLAHCWGENHQGTLGDGTATDRLAAVPVSGGLRFTALSTGRDATCGISGGRAWCWGKNESGELGTASAPDRCIGSPCSLRPVPVEGALRFRSISVGAAHACALTDEGRAYCWGFNWAGALGARTPRAQRTPVAVSSSLRFASIAAGESFTCALTAAGEAFCWGLDRQGELGDGPTPQDCRDAGGNAVECRWAPVAVAGGLRFRSIEANGESACGITRDGDAYCWGAGARGIPADRDQAAPPTPEPVRVPGTVRFASIVPPSWDGAACGLDDRGGAWCWGRGSEVFLSDDYAPRRSPVAVARGHVFRALARGNSHACGLEAGGAVRCWGFNVSGQLGNGRTSDSDPPSRVLLKR